MRTFLSVVSALSILAAVDGSVIEKRQCQATLNTALTVATTMQAHYFNTGTGQYNGGSLWTDANTLEDLHNLMLATGTDQFAARLHIGTAFWVEVTDDALWVVLALWKIADYKIARGLSATPYLNSALTIYNIIAGQWDNTCGGGVWWSTAHTYKNSITNELFLLVSATGALNFPTQAAFLTNANLAWNWLKNSGLRNSAGLWNDGLTQDGTCKNNGQTTWTYNQGVIASGLSALSADATIKTMSTNNILRESCDNAAAGGAVCNQDQQIFKGIWTKSVQYYLDRANDPARNAKYSAYLGSQSSAVIHFATDAAGDPGSVWYAPNAGGSIWTPKTSASGLEAHIAAAKYGPC
ncbi:glycoside hydrolase family 76 protein [Mycena metata]|uniref:Glycoside hydrolase family 76 protein n=1 Tax=Mycena metata TaxID=1033252 RepID=A0AAD7P0X6_9AGAR|nr:glycoside hydrolase family 76 protein [Mycena metata]